MDLVAEAAHLSGQENFWGVGDGGAGEIFDVFLSYLRISGKIPEGEIDCDGNDQGNEGQGVSCKIIVTI